MAYCTNAELTALTGTSLSTDIQGAIIAQADREINARLALAGLSASASDDTLKAASLNLSIAGVMTRLRADGSKPSSLKVGDISMGDNIDAAITELKTRADESITAYIRSNGTYSRDRWYIRKVNR